MWERLLKLVGEEGIRESEGGGGEVKFGMKGSEGGGEDLSELLDLWGLFMGGEERIEE